jgi:hypothetical protein
MYSVILRIRATLELLLHFLMTLLTGGQLCTEIQHFDTMGRDHPTFPPV